MEVPNCCGDRMKILVETSYFLEVECPKCRDTIYIKKDGVKPQLIDD